MTTSPLETPRRWPLIVAAILALLSVAALAAPADLLAKSGKGKPAGSYAPPKGKLFAGVSDTGQGSDYRQYRKQTGAHPAVMQSFEVWGKLPKEAISRWDDTRTRGMLSLSTSPCWGCDATISSQSIAEGKGDKYIAALAKTLAKRNEPTYIRLFPEMNGHWNAYSAFGGSGKPRSEAYSTANFKLAWKRFAMIIRGGDRGKIDKKLRKLGLPKLQVTTKDRLASPKVALAWVPQAFGSPNVSGNQPEDYFPGYDYVDWAGADIYGKYPSVAGLNSLYRDYSKVPFLIGEWSPWDADKPKFVDSLVDWVAGHGRAKMAIYYQGFGEGLVNDFEISDYPSSLKKLRHRLNENKFAQYAPENVKADKSKGKGKGGKGKSKGKSKSKGSGKGHRG